jgi:CYTH domain-containing protein
MAGRAPGEGRYAHLEREQRWIARAVPPDAGRPVSIVDRYISGTRLRLRRSESDGEVVFKLGQKVRSDPADPEVLKLTNLYLSAEEYAVLAALAASESRKTRWHAAWEGRTVSIDQFRGRLDGLVLAEVELGADEPLLSPPPYALRDVTNEDRFSGGALAFASDAAVAALLIEVAAAAR